MVAVATQLSERTFIALRNSLGKEAADEIALLIGNVGNTNSLAEFNPNGDGVNLDDAAFARAIAALNDGDTLIIPKPKVRYLISDAIALSKSIRFVGDGSMPEIKQTVASKHGIVVTASNVSIDAIKLTGFQSATQRASTESAIRCFGASAASPYTDIIVRRCKLSSWGGDGVDLKWVTGFSLQENEIDTVNYAGVSGQSVIDGVISGNRITNIVGSPNAYGVTLSRTETDSLTTDPRSSRVVVSGNMIRAVSNWTGIDSHGGEYLTISGNVVYGCYMGIALVVADGAGQVNMFGPQNCTISGNTVDSLRDDGTADAGIVVAGAGSVGSVTNYAEGHAITGNIVRRHGLLGQAQGGGIKAQVTKGLTVVGNSCHSCSPHGINLYYENKSFSVSANTVLDCWSSSLTYPSAVMVRSENNSGYIGETTLGRGGRTFTTEAYNTVVHQIRSAAGQCAIVTGRCQATYGTEYSAGVNYPTLDVNGGNISHGWINRASVTFDPPNTNSNTNAATTVTCYGAALGDRVTVGFSVSVNTGYQLTAHVSSGGTVTVLFRNTTGGAVDLASGTLSVEVWR